MEPETGKISLKVVIIFTDKAVFSETGKHLSNIESLVLQETLNGKKYPEIASDNGYAIEYLKNDVGPKLWRRLSITFGEKVSKANVKIVLQNHLYNEQESQKSITISSSVPDSNSQLLTVPKEEPPKQILPLSDSPQQSSTQSEVEQLQKFAKIYFKKSLESLQGTSTHKVLMALALFPHGAILKAIMAVTGITDSNLVKDSLNELKEMLLIDHQEERYFLLPLVETYIINELNCYPEFEEKSRERWVNWYVEMSPKFHSLIFEKEKENLTKVMDWCVNHQLYHQVNQLWPMIKSYCQ